jgi:hypothetical protein
MVQESFRGLGCFDRKETAMTTVKAIIRNGRIEVDAPIDLPDGTELTISLPDAAQILRTREQDQADPPEAVEAWIRWYDSLEPLEFTSQERAAWEAARQAQKEFELAQWEKHSKDLERHFP